MLSDKNMRSGRNIAKKTFQPVESRIFIALLILSALGRIANSIACEDNIFQSDDKVITKEESIIDRSKGLPVGLRRLFSLLVLDKVVITDDIVNGNTQLRHCRLIVREDFRKIPSEIPEADCNGIALLTIFCSLLDKVLQGFCREFLKMVIPTLNRLHLGIRDREEGIIR